MHINHEFVIDFLKQNLKRGGKALDYGCGAGEVVRVGRSKGIDLYGVDIFYKGILKYDEMTDLLGQYVFEIHQGQIDFPDNTFDIVVNNQVFEHVQNLDAVLKEIHRVLKPGGLILSIFPHKGNWYEGHCGLYFLHWFPKGRMRIYYAYLMRSVGLGLYKQGKTKHQWVNHVCDYLDNYTCYRSINEINKCFSKYFNKFVPYEMEYLSFRFEHGPRIARGLARVVQVRLLYPLLTFAMKKRVGIAFSAENLSDSECK